MACKLHTHTRDAEPPLTFEDHHTTPQSWQIFALTADAHGLAVARSIDSDIYESMAAVQRIVGLQLNTASTALYDPRTTELARTCHGNVHYWIVKVMRYTASATPGEIDARNLEAIIKSFRANNGGIRTRVFSEAIEAPRRYVAAGHSLRELMYHGLWGQI